VAQHAWFVNPLLQPLPAATPWPAGAR
jgi:hypothetical protein